MNIPQKILLSLSDSFSEKYLQPARIDHFIYKESRIIFRQLAQKGIESFSNVEQGMLLRINQKLPAFGVDGCPVELKVEKNNLQPEEIHIWQAALENGKVLNKGVLQSQSAAMLFGMLGSAYKVSPFLEENMELLLRHVEVKREQALHEYSTPLSKSACWEERCAIGVLFSAFAQQRQDWRFLNAALKLNEWLWKEFHRPFMALSALPLLASLVEQEAAFRELQSC